MERQLNYQTIKRDFLVANLSSGAAILLFLGFLLLKQKGFFPNPPCVVHDLLHVYCVGCGGTRAAFELLRGEILQSLYHNPAVVLGIVLIAYYEAGALVTLAKRDGRLYGRKKWPVYVYLVVVGTYAVVRDVLLVVAGIDMLGDFLH